MFSRKIIWRRQEAYRCNGISDEGDEEISDAVAEQELPQIRPLSSTGAQQPGGGHDQHHQIKSHGYAEPSESRFKKIGAGSLTVAVDQSQQGRGCARNDAGGCYRAPFCSDGDDTFKRV
jgi:hypothetical protein